MHCDFIFCTELFIARSVGCLSDIFLSPIIWVSGDLIQFQAELKYLKQDFF